MKTRFTYFILCMMAAVLPVSCSKVDTQQTKGFTLALSVDGASTKAGTVAATEEEAEIASVAVYMCKSDGSHSNFTKVYAKSLEKVSGEYPYLVNVNASSMGGSCSVYVIANPPADLGDFTSYDEMIATISDPSYMSSIWTADRFMMFNKLKTSSGTDASYDEDLAGKVVNLNDTDPHVNINLDRLAVKVVAKSVEFIDFTPFHTVVPGSTDTYVISEVNIDGAALLNCSNSFSLLPRKTGTAPYQTISPSSATAYSMENGYYDTVPSSLLFKGIDPGTNEIPAMYCLENNSPLYSALVSEQGQAIEGTKMKGRVTAVIFRAQVKLANGFNSDADITDPIVVDPNTGGWQTKADFSNSAQTFYKYKNTLFADIDILHEMYPALASYSTPSDLRAKGVKVFEDGHMYYTYWIKDTNDILSVTRNTCYTLTVNTIASFGDDVPGGSYDSSAPIDVKEASIGVTLEIGDWADISSDFTL